MRMGSIVVAALFKGQMFNWAAIFKDLLTRQLSHLEGKKGIYLSSYLYHLYRIEIALTKAEREDVETAKEMIKYGCAKLAAANEAKEDPEEEEEEAEILGDEEPAPTPKRLRRLVPVVERQPARSRPDAPPVSYQDSPSPHESRLVLRKEAEADFGIIQERLHRVQAQMAYFEKQRDNLLKITEASVENLVPEVKRLAEQSTLTKKVAQLEANLVVEQKRESKEIARRKELTANLVTVKCTTGKCTTGKCPTRKCQTGKRTTRFFGTKK